MRCICGNLRFYAYMESGCDCVPLKVNISTADPIDPDVIGPFTCTRCYEEYRTIRELRNGLIGNRRRRRILK